MLPYPTIAEAFYQVAFASEMRGVYSSPQLQHLFKAESFSYPLRDLQKCQTDNFVTCKFVCINLILTAGQNLFGHIRRNTV